MACADSPSVTDKYSHMYCLCGLVEEIHRVNYCANSVANDCRLCNECMKFDLLQRC